MLLVSEATQGKGAQGASLARDQVKIGSQEQANSDRACSGTFAAKGLDGLQPLPVDTMPASIGLEHAVDSYQRLDAFLQGVKGANSQACENRGPQSCGWCNRGTLHWPAQHICTERCPPIGPRTPARHTVAGYREPPGFQPALKLCVLQSDTLEHPFDQLAAGGFESQTLDSARPCRVRSMRRPNQ